MSVPLRSTSQQPRSLGKSSEILIDRGRLLRSVSMTSPMTEFIADWRRRSGDRTFLNALHRDMRLGIGYDRDSVDAVAAELAEACDELAYIMGIKPSFYGREDNKFLLAALGDLDSQVNTSIGGTTRTYESLRDTTLALVVGEHGEVGEYLRVALHEYRRDRKIDARPYLRRQQAMLSGVVDRHSSLAGLNGSLGGVSEALRANGDAALLGAPTPYELEQRFADLLSVVALGPVDLSRGPASREVVDALGLRSTLRIAVLGPHSDAADIVCSSFVNLPTTNAQYAQMIDEVVYRTASLIISPGELHARVAGYIKSTGADLADKYGKDTSELSAFVIGETLKWGDEIAVRDRPQLVDQALF